MYRRLCARGHPQLARGPGGQAAPTHPQAAPCAHVSEQGTRGETLSQHVSLCTWINGPRRVHCNRPAKGELHRYELSSVIFVCYLLFAIAGHEDDTSDNLDKVWCFLENVRDPRAPHSGCYSDVKWSERDARFWSSLACFESPDIEGGVKRKVKDKSRDPVLSIKEDPEFLIVNERESTHQRKITSIPQTSTTFKPLPVPVFDDLDDDEFASVLNTIFQSA